MLQIGDFDEKLVEIFFENSRIWKRLWNEDNILCKLKCFLCVALVNFQCRNGRNIFRLITKLVD